MYGTSTVVRCSGILYSIRVYIYTVYFNNAIMHIEYSRVALPCTLPPVWLHGVYLIYFLIGNLSYIPCSEPSRSVRLLDVMYTTDPHHKSKSIIITSWVCS